MKSQLLSIILTSSLLHAAPAASFTPGEIWPDSADVHINAHGGGMLFHEGTYYWCGEHKIAGGAGMYSSKDLYNWNNQGIALPVSGDPQSDIVKGCVIERPKVIFNKKTGKFVMWFHLELKGQSYNAARSAVAAADKVTGPYQYLGSFRPNAGVWPANVPEEMKKPLTDGEAAAISKIRLPGAGQARNLHPDGGSLETRKRHRRSLDLAAHPVRSVRQAIHRLEGPLGSRTLKMNDLRVWVGSQRHFTRSLFLVSLPSRATPTSS